MDFGAREKGGVTHDAGESLGEAAGPRACGGALVAGNADLDLSLGVHVSHELDECGGEDLGGGSGFHGGRVTDAAAVVCLGVCSRVCLGGGGSPGSSLCLSLGATEGVTGGCACAGCICNGFCGGKRRDIPDNLEVLHLPVVSLTVRVILAISKLLTYKAVHCSVQVTSRVIDEMALKSAHIPARSDATWKGTYAFGRGQHR